ncbi:hypothetical protein, partial [Xenorhabdus sp. GDc328]|uniref:hypothetical protein n=1 Tax=Xenorhabdus sp. GDc328 TaxID=742178 RepID=UPI001F3E6BE2
VSLSTLRLLCYRRTRKTRYVVVWLTFYGGTFIHKINTAFPSAPPNSAKGSMSGCKLINFNELK